VEFWSHEVAILCPPAVVNTGFDMGIDYIWRDAANLNEPIVLDENCLA